MVLSDLLKEHIGAEKGVVSIATVVGAAAKGYCDSQGISAFDNPDLMDILYIPAFLHIPVGIMLGHIEYYSDEDNALDGRKWPFTLERTIVGTIIGGFEIILGYSVGYTAGSLLK